MSELPPSLAGVIETALAERPEHVLLKTGASSWTIRHILDHAERIIAALPPDGPVLVMLDNHPEHVAVIMALARCGRTWLPVNVKFKTAQLMHLLTLMPAETALIEDHYRANLLEAGFRGGLISPFGLKPNGQPTPSPRAASQPDALRAIMLTSGTTGMPKGVMVTESMFAASGRFAAMACDARDGDVIMLWEPLYHIGGAQMIGAALETGATLAMVERFSASQFWAQAKAFGATKMHYLGGVLDLLMAQPPGPQDRDHEISLAFGAGAKADRWRAFEERFGVQLREVYGMTEAASFSTINASNTIGSIGGPLPWFDIKLTAEPLGEILIRGRAEGLITPGYINNEAATAQALQDGWLHTGDLGRRLPNGELAYAGRTKESIRCRGENVSALEVETLISTHPAIAECAVIGVPAEIGEEEIMLVAQLGAPIDWGDFGAWCERQLAPFQCPRYVQVIEEFPRTPSMRISKTALDRETGHAIDLMMSS